MAAMKAETLDITIAAVGSKTTYVGAGVTSLGWFLSNEFFGLVGVLIGIGAELQQVGLGDKHQHQCRKRR